jgi:hypothetical protein
MEVVVPVAIVTAGVYVLMAVADRFPKLTTLFTFAGAVVLLAAVAYYAVSYPWATGIAVGVFALVNWGFAFMSTSARSIEAKPGDERAWPVWGDEMEMLRILGWEYQGSSRGTRQGCSDGM